MQSLLRGPGLHRTGVGVCLNESECVAFASSRNFTWGSTPRKGTRCIIFFNFFTQIFLCACRVCVPISVANGQKTWPPNANTHTHTDRQFELYIVQAPTPGFARGTTHARCFSFPLHSAAVGSGGETGRLFIGRDYSRKYLKMRLMVGEAEGV